MLHLLWDASALVKRYAPEQGSDTVHALFTRIPASRMSVTLLGYVEVYAALVRKRNRGVLKDLTYNAARSLLRDETLDTPDFMFLTVGDDVFLAGIEFIEKHNLNTSDAAVLSTFLKYAQARRLFGDNSLLVTSDARLFHAANVEGLPALNPEAVSPDELEAALAAS